MIFNITVRFCSIAISNASLKGGAQNYGMKIEKINFIEVIKGMMCLSNHIMISGHLRARFMLA